MMAGTLNARQSRMLKAAWADWRQEMDYNGPTPLDQLCQLVRKIESGEWRIDNLEIGFEPAPYTSLRSIENRQYAAMSAATARVVLEISASGLREPVVYNGYLRPAPPVPEKPATVAPPQKRELIFDD